VSLTGLASGAAVGSCATEHREPSQGLTAAALSGTLRVPQISLTVAPDARPDPEGGGTGLL